MSKNRKLRSPTALFMSAVIICDDLAFRASAASALARVGRQDDVNVQWTTMFWPINALNEGPLAEKAVVEALNAHLILFPARCAQSLPHWVFDWLSRWATRRTIRDAALGIMADEHTAELAYLTPPELFQFVRKHGLSLLVDEQRPLKNSVEGFADFPCEREAVRPVSQMRLAGFVSKPSYRTFGINE